jgi:beta-lactam-binding protein with PASTA domain
VFKSLTRLGFFVNLLIAIVLLALIIFLFFNSLDWITHHDENIKVPPVVGRNINDATQLLQSQGFDVEVQDSVYIDTAAKASVVRQSPEADAIVKKNRTIYLTINRAVAPLIDMPDLRGFSLQSAEMYLKSIGLKLGDTSYRPDIARNSVLEQRFKNTILLPGTKISMGSPISLILGDGIGNALMNVPDLTGMTLTDARSYLRSLNLEVGAVVPDADVQDRNNAYVYHQNPAIQSPGGQQNKIHPGQTIDVYLSVQQPVADTAAIQVPPPPTPSTP